MYPTGFPKNPTGFPKKLVIGNDSGNFVPILYHSNPKT
jgi:hypothetical protein